MAGRTKRRNENEGADYEREQLLDAGTESSDEDFVLKTKGTTQNPNSKLKDVKSQVEEVTNIMKENVNKLFERGDRLDELNERSENLRSVSNEFHTASSRLRRTMWWQEMRTRMILGSFASIVILIMIVWLTVKYH